MLAEEPVLCQFSWRKKWIEAGGKRYKFGEKYGINESRWMLTFFAANELKYYFN